MPIKERHKLTFDEVLLFLVLDNALLMGLHYWSEDLTIPREREDLPAEWRGKHVISFQQRLMFCDVSKKKLFRTGRKIFKTGIMEINFIQKGILYLGRTTREGLFVTPNEATMKPWQDRLKTRIDNNPLFSMLKDRFSVGDGIISFKTGFKWWCRIEGTCLSYDSVVMDAVTGLPHRIGEMENNRPSAIYTIDPETYEMRVTKDFDVIRRGDQETFTLKLRDNWEIRATANHPFMTPDGWKRLDELKVGDRIAVVENQPCKTRYSCITDAEARILGYMLGDGGMTDGKVGFTNKDNEIVEDFYSACMTLGVGIKYRGRYDYTATNGMNGGSPNAVMDFLRDQGIWGLYSYEKHVPKSIFVSNDYIVSEFIAALWTCDGTVFMSPNGSAYLGYCSNSYELISDLSHLLLRFGIRCRIKYKPSKISRFKRPNGEYYEAPVREAWELVTADVNNIRRFQEKINIVGEKKRKLDQIVINFKDRKEAEWAKRIPYSILSREIGKLYHGSQNKLLLEAGYKSCVNEKGVTIPIKTLGRFDTVGRVTARTINNVIESETIENLSEGALTWIKIKSIERFGVEPTFDLVVPDTHSFVANGFVVHNSSASNAGRSMVGLRAADVMMDEADFGSEDEDMHRQQSALPDASWLMGGVPRGRIHHNPFRRKVYDKEMKKGWSIHAETTGNYSMWINPLYASEQAHDSETAKVGGTNTPGYITQILGKDSDALSSSFPIRPKDIHAPYRYVELTEAMLDVEKIAAWDMVIPLPQPEAPILHSALGLDYGYSPDPTIITVGYATRPPVWRQLLRLRLVTVSEAVQRQVVLFLHDHYHFSAIAIDAVGAGGPLFHNLQSHLGNLVIPGALGGKAETDVMLHKACKNPVIFILGELYCETCQRSVNEEDTEKLRIPQKQYLTENMKNALHFGSQYQSQSGPFAGGYFPDLPYPVWLLANDGEIDDELGGTTEEQQGSGFVKYDYPGDQDHNTESLRMQMAAVLDIRARDGAGRLDPRNPGFGERNYGGWIQIKGRPTPTRMPWDGRKKPANDEWGELEEIT